MPTAAIEFARDLQLKGDLVAAADLLEQAIELAPAFVSAWFTLGEIREQLGERDAAIAAFQEGARRRCQRSAWRGPAADAAWARKQLSAMPPAYVRTLFDQYAPRFDRALIDDLGYRGPSLLFKAVLSARHAVKKPAFFKRAIDLGCGTGLAATAFAKEVDHFTGIDLSPGMIEKAKATGLYAELEVGDMLEGLRTRPEASADLVLAADAMVYVPDLVPVLTEVSRVLAAGGLAGVHAGDGMPATASSSAMVCVTPTVPHYVRTSLAAAGLTLSQIEEQSFRTEINVPVPGLVVVAAKA